ncbi:hypothetical protein ACI6PS_07290 [Flavobacterium sp. PLA-1-15]|uniref:hypothetical protein n=1 Tax=Flavobacterium sp. PLA-1-15 TaxID=3380533 RepID=UPI003B7FC236
MENSKTEQNENVNHKKTAVLPTTEIDLGTVASSASKKWLDSPWLTLLWMKAPDFATKVALFETTVDSRRVTGSTRPQITKSLRLLNREIEDSLTYVKNYIIEKHKKETAKSYFPSFGMVVKGKGYILPRDQNSRSKALKMMIEACVENDFKSKEYGTGYWEDVKDRFDSLLELASSTDGTVSLKVGDKNILKKEVKKVLNALIGVIKSNYPDTYKHELRSWGFQKEKY